MTVFEALKMEVAAYQAEYGPADDLPPDSVDNIEAAVRDCLRWATSTAEPRLALDNIAVRLRQLIEEKP